MGGGDPETGHDPAITSLGDRGIICREGRRGGPRGDRVYTVEDDRIYISIQCWDVSADVLAAGLQQTARFNIAFYSSLHDRVVEMLPQIHLETPRGPPLQQPLP